MLTPFHPFRFLCALSLSCALHGLIVQALGISGSGVPPEQPARLASLRISMIASPAGRVETAPAKPDMKSGSGMPQQARNAAAAAIPVPLPAARPDPGAASFPQPASGAPMVDVPVPAEPYYFKTSELSEKPEVVKDIPADFALLVSGQGFQSAIVRLRIDEAGDIDDVLFDASTFSEGNQRIVREAISGMRFTPGKLDALAVKSELRIEIAVDGGTP